MAAPTPPSAPGLRRIAVFCGSRSGKRPEYAAAAIGLGRLLAERKLGLVYGGGNVGLMGQLADACLAAGGEVIGVIPEALMGLEIAGQTVDHPRLSRQEVVDSMHTRKARMASLADAFIALPGGYGTLEELFEVITWAQLGFHHKPIGLLDVAGYYTPLLALLDQAVDADFLSPGHRRLLHCASQPAQLLAALSTHQPPVLPAWLENTAQL